jgi:hypothetical protein
MHPTSFEVLAQLHIEDLHREAARQRLVRRRPKQKSGRRKGLLIGLLQRAPAS